MKKVLFVSGGPLDYGGISSWMFNYIGRIDSVRVKFDFIVHGMERGPREQDAEAFGAKVWHVPYKRQDYSGNRVALEKVFASGEYAIVHSHLDGMNSYILSLAKAAGVPVRISHCHNTGYLTTNPVRRLIHAAAKRRIPAVATHMFACSEAAALFFYGDALVNAGKVCVIKNAVDLDRYRFDPDARARLRAEFGIPGDAFAVGNIGRFEHQKNHAFLMDAFSKLKAVRRDAVLVIAGDGVLRPEIERQIVSLGLSDSVRLLGYRADADKLYSAFDAFALPSRFEGLGIVLVEAQMAGLPCFASEAVPRDACITDCTFLPLDASRWAEALHHAKIGDRTPDRRSFEEAGFDIGVEAKKLEAFYEELPV